MPRDRLLQLVDAKDFRTLFIEELGWNNPDSHSDLVHEVDGAKYTFHQVASYRGMRIWHCDSLPNRRVQRQLDVLVGRTSQERLIIFTADAKQQWRWPRRGQLGATNAKLIAHEYVQGDDRTHLLDRLRAIQLDFDEDISLVQLLERMRDAFDTEAETASVAAARLMGSLYTELEKSRVGEHEATLLLARLLFLFFGDDADMWPKGLFESFLRHHTTVESMNTRILELFEVLDTDERNRKLPENSPYKDFRYINGKLFGDPLRLPTLSPAFRDRLLDACEFDWSIISPAIFGSMFQTVKSKEARRLGGEHYTTEENILKTLEPLFLDDYQRQLQDAWNDKGRLTKLHNEIGKLRFMDPACGCGNFLIVAYREMRAIELELMKRRRDLDIEGGSSGKTDRTQLTLDVTADIKVTVDHFYGIEIEEWPARIAEVAMLLMDHLANQQTALEFGIAPDRLPIRIASEIHHGNALKTDWTAIVPPSDSVLIFGNPPFGGDRTLAPSQKEDLRNAWGGRFTSHLDYCTGWFVKAVNYFGDHNARWAFVATNSICQGEPVADLWPTILDAGWRCRFAHRSFRWETEAPERAAVHVSIVGFDRKKAPDPVLWAYPEGGVGEPTELAVPNVNPYLRPGPNVLVRNRNQPLSQLPPIMFGNMPRDGGFLIVEPDDYDVVHADTVARKFLRPYVGGTELLYDRPRWCLWLTEPTPEEIQRSAILRERVAGCKASRLQSRAAATQRMASTPHLFAQRTQAPGDFLAIPHVTSEHREYFTVREYPDGVIASNLVYTAPDPDGFAMGVLSSSMFITWMRAVGGRLEGRLRFSKEFTYNTFPLPKLTAPRRAEIATAAGYLRTARSLFPDKSLADLYTPGAIPRAVLEAHIAIDRLVDKAFSLEEPTSVTREETLLAAYRKLTSAET